jgi:quercetin dioxygenase-like cupin family protein
MSIVKGTFMTATVSVQKSNPASGLWVIRDRVRFLGDVPRPGFALLEVTVPPGSGTPPHRHASPEIFHVVEGEISVGTFEEARPSFTIAGQGDSVSIASNVPHNYQNAGTSPARMLVVVDDRMAAFFQEAGQTAEPPQGPPTPDEIGRIMSVCGRHGIEVLPPPAN